MNEIVFSISDAESRVKQDSSRIIYDEVKRKANDA